MLVDAPTVAPPGFGLWSVVQTPDASDPHWRNGVQFQPESCAPAAATLPNCPPSDDDYGGEFDKPPTDDGISTRGGDPFAVYARIRCGPVGGVWEQARARAVAALTAGESWAVERVFWTGQTPAGTVYPHLAANAEVTDPGAASPDAYQTVIQPAADVVTAGPVDVVEALAVLEGALGDCYRGVGVIHMTRAAAVHLASYGLLIRQGPQLRTLLGTLVAAGGGYPGTGPDGSAPMYPEAWMYATGAVVGYRSEISMPTPAESLDRRRNTLVLIPERSYVISWDCCLLAVLAHLGGRGGGAPNSPDSL